MTPSTQAFYEVCSFHSLLETLQTAYVGEVRQGYDVWVFGATRHDPSCKSESHGHEAGGAGMRGFPAESGHSEG